MLGIPIPFYFSNTGSIAYPSRCGGPPKPDVTERDCGKGMQGKLRFAMYAASHHRWYMEDELFFFLIARGGGTFTTL